MMMMIIKCLKKGIRKSFNFLRKRKTESSWNCHGDIFFKISKEKKYFQFCYKWNDNLAIIHQNSF